MSEMNAVYNVKQYILNLIKQNKLEYGDQLPSNLSIARELNVKTDDVYEAIQALITEQVIKDNFEEGTSVKSLPPFFYPLNELISIGQMIKNAGFECGTEYLNFDEQPATMLDANLLSVEEGYPVTIIERLRTADGEPVVYCLDKIAKKELTCTEYQKSNGSILSAIKEQSNHNICYADTEIEAVNYEPRISEVLNASPHEGLILLKITHYNESDEPILYSLNYMKNSLVQFKITRKI
ncbi:TPA: GntR family transcriptional regulator [Staphylococcus aureus]|uniref:GntR family transcriptional regulator n=1 Tax=Staphylococcus aureus TaxID=1280 RepID=UPI00091420E3|nr:GntR family transcriptional regulator [Staphylococcus aureus]MBR9028747.1 GntR family transcriptional regulator [Staphylococcus aureus]MBS3284743.1 GntR family transcriptional regulator [Staphylococcus aureus]MBS3291635.1 GntR family transcriptional regulator [Staphylococcus aureus]MBS3302271.1 GntR family transcriptional regulator [Staphylococcus aureus]MBS3337040.1 GntR family transcriptional regulator [Staphylococcus aureus]